MMHQTRIAKITRPALPEVFPRTRLFRLLDRSNRHRVTWVTGPPGSGKTTLIANYLTVRKLSCIWYQADAGDADLATFFYYLGLAAKKAAPQSRKALPLLTPEYLLDVPTFSRRYFEYLSGRLHPPFAIVFDNYQEVLPESPFHDVLRAGLSAVPEGIAIVIISRAAPPPAFAGMLAGNELAMIGWDELRLTAEESGGIANLHIDSARSRETTHWMHEKTQGWAAGLILLSKYIKREAFDPQALAALAPEMIFDYFANELFDKRTDETTKDFLLKTAVLPKVTPAVAERLTGNKEADRILSELNRRNYFTEKRHIGELTYQYHPLFREFLLSRAKNALPHDELVRLQLSGARLMQESGFIEDAAELYLLAGVWESLARLVLAGAPPMISQGRHRSLEKWLRSLPEETIGRDPWLLYWMGVCRMPFGLAEGRGYFERAFALFRERHDASGVFLAWSGAVESIIQEVGDLRQLDPWIDLFDDLLKKQENFPSQQIEGQVTSRVFMALMLRRPWHPRFNDWRKKALALLDGNADPSLRMMTGFYLYSHFYFTGDYSTCEHVIDVVRRTTKANKDMSPLAQNMVNTTEAWFAWAKGAHEVCLQKVRAGLEKSKESGVHIWDNVILTAGSGACLSIGDLPGADALLEKMAAALGRARVMDRFYYHHWMAWRYFLLEDIPQAVTHQEQAHAHAEKLALWTVEALSNFGMAHLLHARGEQKRAMEHVVRCREIGRRFKSAYLEFRVRLLEASFAFQERNGKKGLTHLREAMALGRERGFVYFAWWHPSLMTPLCVKALQAGIETDYVKKLVRTCNLVPESPLRIENWPWPIRIRTLGRFALLKDEKPVNFSGKVQKKPLDLLKALIAFGGRDVGEDRLCDALWPDAEGDRAHKSFEMTLQRLRRLLGNDQAIQLQGGQATLDERYCWVDAWEFERALEVENEKRGREDTEKARPSLPLLEQALSLYRGHFLPMDARQPWSVVMRERLRSRFLRLIVSTGEQWSRAGELKKAVDHFERGLEVDPLAEELYQHLMLCYKRLGQESRAMAAYNRCRTMLSQTLGLNPSSRTEEIRRTIAQGRKGEGENR